MKYAKMLKGFEIVRECVDKLDAYLGGGRLCLYVDDYELYHRMFVKPYGGWVHVRRRLSSVGFTTDIKAVVVIHAGEDHLCMAAFRGSDPVVGMVCDYTSRTGKTFCLKRQNTGGGEWTMHPPANELEMLNDLIAVVRVLCYRGVVVATADGLFKAMEKDLFDWWGEPE